MHATKGGWVGQTFALAKCNDSGGRKSRIRRSKEERKAMVESFINKYQNSNNGNFPSLNLTHKNVGGSFYTVREIVREIIQENRVLGPSKLTPEEQNAESFFEQYPLGSISIEPQIHVASSKETHIITPIVPSHHQDTSEEQVLDSSGQYSEPQNRRLDDGKILNRSIKAAERNGKSDEPIYTELRVGLEVEQDVEKEPEASKAKISHITADVVVETFPLRPVSKTVYGLDGQLGETRVFNGTLQEKEIENIELEAGNNNSVLHRIDFLENSFSSVDEKADAKSGGLSEGILVDEKTDTNLEGPLSERILMDEKSYPSVESVNCTTTKQNIALDVIDGTDLEVKDSLPAGSKAMYSHNGTLANLNSTNTGSCHGDSISEEAIVVEKKSDSDRSGSSQKGSDPMLDRMNLESWGATSEKSTGLETNPLLAFFKAFFSAFVKFCSE